MGEKTSLKISVEPGVDMVDLFGAGNVNLTELEKKYCVDVSVASDGINISGDSDNAAMAANVIKTYMVILKEGKTLDETTLNYVSDIVKRRVCGVLRPKRLPHFQRETDKMQNLRSKGIYQSDRFQRHCFCGRPCRHG